MDVKLNIKYQLDLSRDEWLVVSKALRAFAGDFPRDEDREIAAALQEQMLQQKHNVLSQMTHEAAKHASNIEAKQDPKHYQLAPDTGHCACGNLWPCTRMTGPGKGRKS